MWFWTKSSQGSRKPFLKNEVELSPQPLQSTITLRISCSQMVVFSQWCIFFGVEMIKTHSKTYFGPEYLRLGKVLDQIFITFCYDFRKLLILEQCHHVQREFPTSFSISQFKKNLGNREISMSRCGLKKVSLNFFV